MTAIEQTAAGPMFGKVANLGLHRGYSVDVTLDPKVQPFLHDHQIDGTTVLPGVMGIEAFAEAASCLLPGWHIEGFEDVNFLAPFKFYRNEPRTITVETAVRPQGNALIAECRLIGLRMLPNQAESQVNTHFTARMRLTRHAPAGLSASTLGRLAGRVIEASDIYRLYFHGPAYQVLERAWWDGQRIVGLFAKSLRSNHYPSELPTVMAPRLIELCFQTAGLWEMGVQGRMGLPRQVGHVTLLRAPETSEGPLYAVVVPSPNLEFFDGHVVDAKGNCYLELTGYRTVAVPGAVKAEDLKALQSLMSGAVVVAA